MDSQKMNDRPSTLISQWQTASRQLAILVDPDKFDLHKTTDFLARIPAETRLLFVGGSQVVAGATDAVVSVLKSNCDLPVVLFPGDYTQLTDLADAVLFLSLYSGDNPEYLIGQQRKAVPFLKTADLEVISTAYLLIDGGKESAVSRVTGTKPMSQDKVEAIVEVALAAQLVGSKCIYLEAGSGALNPVEPSIITAVRQATNIPLIVGGGIRSKQQQEAAYRAGAQIVVMGTVYENQQL